MRELARLCAWRVRAVGIAVVIGVWWLGFGAQAAELASAGLPPIEQFTYTGLVEDVEALGDRVWVATTGGLVELDRKTGRFLRLYTNLDGLPQLSGHDLAVIDGVLWIACWRGLTRFGPRTGEFRVVGEQPVGALHHQPRRRVLWAVSAHGATRVDLSTGKAQSWPLDVERGRVCVIDDEIWASVERLWPVKVRIRCFKPLEGKSREFGPSNPLPKASRAFLCPAGSSVWVMFRGVDRTPHERIGRIDRATGSFRLYRAADGLPGDYPRILAAHGDDVWVVCSEEPDRQFGGGLAQFSDRRGAWEQHLSFSGARRDEPTAIGEVNGDLWVATRGYDETREMIVSRAKRSAKREAPIVKHLALCRWRPKSRSWEVHRFPAEHNSSRILSFWLTSTDFWMVVDRVDRETSRYAVGWGGTDLASCPREGGELKWRRIYLGPSGLDPMSRYLWRRLRVVDDVPWVRLERDTKRFDAAAEDWREVQWPSRLPGRASGLQAIAAARSGEVLLGARGGPLLRLDPTRRQFEPVGSLKISGPERVLRPPRRARDADGTVRMPQEELAPTGRWGPPGWSLVNSFTFGPEGQLWITCGFENPQNMMPAGGYMGMGGPSVFAP
ncbi:MAG: hypothetical protein ACE5JM_09720, partial [Armatimonadota bacterium]